MYYVYLGTWTPRVYGERVGVTLAAKLQRMAAGGIEVLGRIGAMQQAWNYP